jgi:hypothetical protein
MAPILYWNDVALEANKVSHTDGQPGTADPRLYQMLVGARQGHTWHWGHRNVERPWALTRAMGLRQRRQGWPSRS